MKLGPIATDADPIAPDYSLLKASLQARQAATPTVRASAQVQPAPEQVLTDMAFPRGPNFYDGLQAPARGSLHQRPPDSKQ